MLQTLGLQFFEKMNCFRSIFQGFCIFFRKIHFKEHLPLTVFVVKRFSVLKLKKMFTSNIHVLFHKNALLKGTRVTEYKVIFFPPNIPFLYTLKTAENSWLSDSFRGYKKGYWYSVIGAVNSVCHKYTCI